MEVESVSLVGIIMGAEGVSSVRIIMGGSGGFFPPTGVWGQSPQWGFRGQSPLPLIVPIKIWGQSPPQATHPNSFRNK